MNEIYLLIFIIGCISIGLISMVKNDPYINESVDDYSEDKNN